MRKQKQVNITDTDYLHRRKLVGRISFLIFAAVVLFLTWLISSKFYPFFKNPYLFQQFIESYGWKGRLVALGLQFLQVVVALIPGEFIEIGTGYAFGPIESTFICLVGVAIGSTLIFLFTKCFGVQLVELFVGRDKINSLHFINNEKKLKRTLFLLYFIPGTPKDLLTYFAGLTQITLLQFLGITLIARIPSLVSSTVGGSYIAAHQYGLAAILFVITGIISLAGWQLYNLLVKKHNNKKNLKKS